MLAEHNRWRNGGVSTGPEFASHLCEGVVGKPPGGVTRRSSEQSVFGCCFGCRDRSPPTGPLQRACGAPSQKTLGPSTAPPPYKELAVRPPKRPWVLPQRHRLPMVSIPPRSSALCTTGGQQNDVLHREFLPPSGTGFKP